MYEDNVPGYVTGQVVGTHINQLSATYQGFSYCGLGHCSQQFLMIIWLFDHVYIMTNYVMFLNPLMHTLIRTNEPTGSAFTNMAAWDDEQVCLCWQLHKIPLTFSLQ